MAHGQTHAQATDALSQAPCRQNKTSAPDKRVHRYVLTFAYPTRPSNHRTESAAREYPDTAVSISAHLRERLRARQKSSARHALRAEPKSPHAEDTERLQVDGLQGLSVGG